LTYFPPIWLRTFAYSFSAPTATITRDFELADAPVEGRSPRTLAINTAPDRADRAANRGSEPRLFGVDRALMA
jgi:hypothetical protein